MASFGTAVGVVGYAAIMIGGLWFLIAAFRESVWWGLGVLLIPFVELFYLFSYWEDAKKPFGIQILGIIFLLASAFVFESALPEMMMMEY